MNRAYSKGLRFPRSKYVRRLETLDDELGEWEQGYAHMLEEERTPVVEARIRARMQGIDWVRHALYETVHKLIEIV